MVWGVFMRLVHTYACCFYIADIDMSLFMTCVNVHASIIYRAYTIS